MPNYFELTTQELQNVLWFIYNITVNDVKSSMKKGILPVLVEKPWISGLLANDDDLRRHMLVELVGEFWNRISPIGNFWSQAVLRNLFWNAKDSMATREMRYIWTRSCDNTLMDGRVHAVSKESSFMSERDVFPELWPNRPYAMLVPTVPSIGSLAFKTDIDTGKPEDTDSRRELLRKKEEYHDNIQACKREQTVSGGRVEHLLFWNRSLAFQVLGGRTRSQKRLQCEPEDEPPEDEDSGDIDTAAIVD